MSDFPSYERLIQVMAESILQKAHNSGDGRMTIITAKEYAECALQALLHGLPLKTMTFRYYI